MHTRTLSCFYFLLTLFLGVLFSNPSVAHTDDINQATLSLTNGDHYQLTVTVDLIHLLKQYLNISGDDEKVMIWLNQQSLSEQKSLLEQLKQLISQQSKIYFDNKATNIAVFKGLELQYLKRILSQQLSATEYKTQLQATGSIPENVSAVNIRLSPLLGNVILKVVRPEQEVMSAAALSNSYQTKTVNQQLAGNSQPSTTALALAGDYIYQGFVHILPKGLDHILFVLALFLFAKRRSTLIWQISAFTLAHTITLALGIYGIISLPGDIVEPLIALSIVYVGLENIYRAKNNKTSHTRMPIIFAFGLLHGLGFASVLADVGLPPSQYALSLISFNIGVELGQLSVIALAFISLLPFRAKGWYQTKLVLALNIAIAIVASYWVIERIT
ncbi:HupE/UreJ family protein [Cognaticolwellia aestuarii]|uniref:HupE/UreJ family protein n=1 Tax=Cognaticolwellia aestuarii TaxID=329993 RepID=UPI001930FD4A|nr:HupE/UreJ family protein [Cognaticolwellia aestuarii]